MPVSMTRLEFNWDDSQSRKKLDMNAVQAVAAVWLADKNASRHAVMDLETVVDEPFSFAFNGLSENINNKGKSWFSRWLGK